MAFIGSVPYSESLFAGEVVIAAPRALPIIQLEANRLQLLATDAPRRLRSLGSLLLERDKTPIPPAVSGIGNSSTRFCRRSYAGHSACTPNPLG